MCVFVTRHSCYTFGLEDMAGSTFEDCLCLSFVLLLRLSSLRCPSPNHHLRDFFAADPFSLDAHIDVCSRVSDPTVSKSSGELHGQQTWSSFECSLKVHSSRLLGVELQNDKLSDPKGKHPCKSACFSSPVHVAVLATPPFSQHVASMIWQQLNHSCNDASGAFSATPSLNNIYLFKKVAVCIVCIPYSRSFAVFTMTLGGHVDPSILYRPGSMIAFNGFSRLRPCYSSDSTTHILLRQRTLLFLLHNHLRLVRTLKLSL